MEGALSLPALGGGVHNPRGLAPAPHPLPLPATDTRWQVSEDPAGPLMVDGFPISPRL